MSIQEGDIIELRRHITQWQIKDIDWENHRVFVERVNGKPERKWIGFQGILAIVGRNGVRYS